MVAAVWPPEYMPSTLSLNVSATAATIAKPIALREKPLRMADGGGVFTPSSMRCSTLVGGRAISLMCSRVDDGIAMIGLPRQVDAAAPEAADCDWYCSGSRWGNRRKKRFCSSRLAPAAIFKMKFAGRSRFQTHGVQ